MNRIHIESVPPNKSYDTFEHAVAGSKTHPLQQQAQRTSKRLYGSVVKNILWSRDSCLIIFTNGYALHVRSSAYQLEWEVRKAVATVPQAKVVSFELAWKSGEVTVFDPDSDFSDILGRQFSKLFINEVGLLLYTRGVPILWFQACRISETNAEFLYAFFE